MPAHPAIRTIEEAEDALRLLGEFDALEASVKADCAKAIAAAKADAAAKLVHITAAGPVPLGDARAELESRLEKYASAHRAKLFPEKKSRSLWNGIIGFRLSKPAIAPIDGEEADVLQTLRDAVMPALNAALNKVKLAKKLPASSVLTVDVALNKAGLLQGVDQSRVNALQLETLGLQIVPAEDRFFATPSKTPVQTEAAS